VSRWCPGCGWWHPANQLAELLWTIEYEPEYVAKVPDLVLAVLDVWSDSSNATVAAEVKRRRDRYLQLAALFTTNPTGPAT
jgi:hypothetical protein